MYIIELDKKKGRLRSLKEALGKSNRVKERKKGLPIFNTPRAAGEQPDAKTGKNQELSQSFEK